MTTMYVELDGGKIEERRIASVNTNAHSVCGRAIGQLSSQPEPVIADNERVVWRVGNSIPLIIKVPE